MGRARDLISHAYTERAEIGPIGLQGAAAEVAAEGGGV